MSIYQTFYHLSPGWTLDVVLDIYWPFVMARYQMMCGDCWIVTWWHSALISRTLKQYRDFRGIHVCGIVYHVCGIVYHIRGILYHICGILYHKCVFPGNPYTVKARIWICIPRYGLTLCCAVFTTWFNSYDLSTQWSWDWECFPAYGLT